MLELNKLAPQKVAQLKTPGRYNDGGGLYLQVTKAPEGHITKSWIFRYRLAGHVSRAGRPLSREMGLGSIGTFSLAEAREIAKAQRQMVWDGLDPIDERQKKREEKIRERARTVGFKEAATRYIAAHEAGWRNEKHRGQWPATLEAYAYPFVGPVSVALIDTAMVLKILEPIWAEKPQTAKRVRGRIETVLDWATARGFRSGDNPARWRGHLDKLLPSPTKVKAIRHHPALPYEDVPAFMADLRVRAGISARALEFTVLNGARTSEVIGATWDEIDFANKVWTVPAGRMKGEREHRVPLSDRSIRLLDGLPRERGSKFVFPGGTLGAPLSNMAMLELLRELRPGLTVHGFRSTFRDWAGERTNFSHEVCEFALAHRIPDKTTAAYRRYTAVDARRRLMSAWARFCTTSPTKRTGNVTSLRPRAKVRA